MSEMKQSHMLLRVDASFPIPEIIAKGYPRGAKCVAVVYADERLMARCPDSPESDALANAQRLAAAWNACAALPTASLEAGVVAEMVEALKVSLAELESLNKHFYRDGEWHSVATARAVLAKIGEA
jgi:hypothetical protein